LTGGKGRGTWECKEGNFSGRGGTLRWELTIKSSIPRVRTREKRGTGGGSRGGGSRKVYIASLVADETGIRSLGATQTSKKKAENCGRRSRLKGANTRGSTCQTGYLRKAFSGDEAEGRKVLLRARL